MLLVLRVVDIVGKDRCRYLVLNWVAIYRVSSKTTILVHSCSPFRNNYICIHTRFFAPTYPQE